MTAPDGEQIAVALEALRADARAWQQMADEVDTAAGAAAGLGLGAWQVSGLGHLLGFDTVYGQLQERIVTLLRQAGGNFDDVAHALTTAADDYEDDERHAVHRLRNIY